MSPEAHDIARPWLPAPEGRFIGRGHPVGDFLEAYEWRVLDAGKGRYRVDAHLPTQVKNPRGQLFGGFAPTYVDLVAVYTVRSALTRQGRVSTVNMRVDYLAPVVDDRFLLESRIVNSRGKTHLVEVLLKSSTGELLVFSIVTLRERD
jgi:acyl-coenzyme A thioesterase PaaI-like protein